MSDTFNHEADAWDSYDWEYEDAGGPVYTPRCKFCGSDAVAWAHTGVRWRLYDDESRQLHRCPRRATSDDFEDLTKE